MCCEYDTVIIDIKSLFVKYITIYVSDLGSQRACGFIVQIQVSSVSSIS